MAASEKSLCEKILHWKSEAIGLKITSGKMEVMFGCSMKDRVEEKGMWPCGVCKKVSAIIIFCATFARSGSISDVVE